jgi:hypothetical protein
VQGRDPRAAAEQVKKTDGAADGSLLSRGLLPFVGVMDLEWDARILGDWMLLLYLFRSPTSPATPADEPQSQGAPQPIPERERQRVVGYFVAEECSERQERKQRKWRKRK